MVQFKKSPLDSFEPPLGDNYPPDQEVWVMRETGEAFTNYDDYLKKYDYYRQKLFTCEITGHGHLTYYAAAESEKNGSVAVESSFPSALREPVLRKVQFQQIPRLDDLVNYLYDAFKDDYFPSETVNIDVNETHDIMTGVITTKTKFAGHKDRPPITRYFVQLKDGGTALVDQHHVYRDRRTFTKQVLRSFLRLAISRENYDGSPWMVKDHFAKQYKIDTVLPRYLQEMTIKAYRKSIGTVGKSDVEIERIVPKKVDNIESMALAIIEHKGKLPKDMACTYIAAYKGLVDPGSVPLHAPSVVIPVRGPSNNKENRPAVTNNRTVAVPEIKYPREDLEVKPKGSQMPRLGLLSLQAEKTDMDDAAGMQSRSRLTSASVGKALMSWAALNIHSKYFLLDSFTFDDFLDVMLYNYDDTPCELLSEIHCAILKTLIDADGNLAANIRSLSDVSSSSSSSPDHSTVSSPAAGAQEDVEMVDAASEVSSGLSEPNDSQMNGTGGNNAEAMLEESDWKLKVKNRDFENGGWEFALVGFLHHMSLVGWVDDAPARILAALAPLDESADEDTARRMYAGMDVNLRLEALEVAIMIASSTRPFKDSMDVRSAQQTTDRKDKVDAQRRKKPLVEELQQLDTTRKLTRPDEPIESVINGGAIDAIEVGDTSEMDHEPMEEESDPDSEPMRGRRRSGRASDLLRKQEKKLRALEEKKAAMEAMAKSQEQINYEQVLADIQTKIAEIQACEKEVEVVDGKLRENSCHRTKCLGADRFCNRYWWFERNGMPFAGHEDSSTAENGYMNGRLWVQGPGELERQGFFDISNAEAESFISMTGDRPSDRRKNEEGPTALRSDTDWAYLDTSMDLEILMSWLDERGLREKALSKELHKWKAQITESMANRRIHLSNIGQQRRQAVEEPIRGVATRTKTMGNENNKLRLPFLAWSNGEARRVLGHTHCEPLAPKRAKGVARPVQRLGGAGFTVANQAARETRRGTKY